MINDDLEDIEELIDLPNTRRKRLMFLLIPIVMVVGLSVGLYYAFSSKLDSNKAEFNIIQYNKDSDDETTVFYDIPEIKVDIKGKDRNHKLRVKINIELSGGNDMLVIKALTPRLTNAALSHMVELYIEELEGSTGLYWLKEELLYRFNLVSAPIKIKNLNFSVFDLEK